MLTAETGTSFNGPNHLLDNVIKCLVVANLVRHHTDPKCQRVVQCADLLAGDTSGRGHKNNAPSMDVLFERARTHAQEFSPMSLRLLDLISRNPYISQSTLQTPWAPVRVSLSLWTSATLPSSGLLRGLLLSTRVNSRVGSSRVSVDVVGHEIKSSWD